MLSKSMSFSGIVNGIYLQITHHEGQLCINHNVINMPYDLCSMSISRDKIYVVYSKIRHDGFYLVDSEIPLNNIAAYDFSGNCVWGLEDVWRTSSVIKDVMRDGVHFCKVEWHTDDTYLKDYPYDMSLNKIPNASFTISYGHEYLVCHSIYGERYTLDLTEGEIVYIANE